MANIFSGTILDSFFDAMNMRFIEQLHRGVSNLDPVDQLGRGEAPVLKSELEKNPQARRFSEEARVLLVAQFRANRRPLEERDVIMLDENGEPLNVQDRLSELEEAGKLYVTKEDVAEPIVE